ncbi:ATP-binding protein [Streptomyces erythrochromogenes]|uniref:ATP-binding protein n=1 Tax=Streptomyces erythrochromogenes TaxID=285574 RepID=UPI003696F06B
MDPPVLVLDRPVPRTGRTTTTARSMAHDFLHHAAQVRAPAQPEYTDAVLMVVTELVITNAIRHTDGSAALHLELHDDHIEIRVTDTSPKPAGPRLPRTDGTGGYGWHLIDRLTTHTHTEPTPQGGKTICAHAPDKNNSRALARSHPGEGMGGCGLALAAARDTLGDNQPGGGRSTTAAMYD